MQVLGPVPSEKNILLVVHNALQQVALVDLWLDENSEAGTYMKSEPSRLNTCTLQDGLTPAPN